eukprot:Skav229828  [mRNA]  locus=scaffold2672:306332:313692:+ [translate_table: standard]
MLVTASDDRTVRLWQRSGEGEQRHQRGQPRGWRCTATCRGHGCRVWDALLAQHLDDHVVVTASEDSVALIPRHASPRPRGHQTRGVRCLEVVGDGGTVVSGGEDGALKRWVLAEHLGDQAVMKRWQVPEAKDWIREVLLLSHDQALVATNYGNIYRLQLAVEGEAGRAGDGDVAAELLYHEAAACFTSMAQGDANAIWIGCADGRGILLTDTAERVNVHMLEARMMRGGSRAAVSEGSSRVQAVQLLHVMGVFEVLAAANVSTGSRRRGSADEELSDFVEPPDEWSLDLYDWRSFCFGLLGVLPFLIGTHLEMELRIWSGVIFFGGLAFLVTVCMLMIPFDRVLRASVAVFFISWVALVIPASIFTVPGSAVRSLATMVSLAVGYVFGLLVTTLCLSPVARPLRRTCAAAVCLIVPVVAAFLLLRYMEQWTVTMDGRLAGLAYFLAAKILMDLNAIVIGAMHRMADFDCHMTAAVVAIGAAGGQIIKFAAFLRSYINADEPIGVLAVSGCASCVLDVFTRLQPFVSVKTKKLSPVKLVMLSLAPYLKSVTMTTVTFYWALSEVSNMPIRGKLRIPPTVALACLLSGLAADFFILLFQNWKQRQGEGLWRTCYRLRLAGQFVPMRHPCPPPMRMPIASSRRSVDVWIAAAVAASSAYWMSITAKYMTVPEEMPSLILESFGATSFPFWLLFLIYVFFEQILATVVTWRAQGPFKTTDLDLTDLSVVGKTSP